MSKIDETFLFLDEDGIGEVPIAKLGTAIRLAGGYPTEAEVKELTAKADPSGSGNFTLSSFQSVMKFVSAPNKEDILSSFKVFDKDGEGKISPSELRHILLSMGERLTDDEVEDFVKEATLDKEGQIDYKMFLEQILSGN
jgi:Ca2+-binding EF-hand superfamily protein